MNDEFQSASSSILGGTAEGRGFSAEFPKTMWLRMSENIFFLCVGVCVESNLLRTMFSIQKMYVSLCFCTHTNAHSIRMTLKEGGNNRKRFVGVHMSNIRIRLCSSWDLISPTTSMHMHDKLFTPVLSHCCACWKHETGHACISRRKLLKKDVILLYRLYFLFSSSAKQLRSFLSGKVAAL